MKRYIFSASILLSLIATTALAQVPQYISYQGLAVDKLTGQPIADGNHTVSVAFFPSADTASVAVANFSMPNVPTVKGVFNLIVQVNPANFTKQLYMGVKLDNSGYLGQPAMVTASPYSFYAMEAAHAKVADSSSVSLRAIHANIADSIKGGVNVASRQSIGAAASGANSDITSLHGLTTPLPISEGGTNASTAITARANLGAAASGANNDITSLNALTSPFAIAQGGTGATTVAGARANLGLAGSGANSDITSLTGLTTPLPLTEGGTGATNAASARTNLGLGTIATQNSIAVNISGGSIDGTIVGMTTPAQGSFTQLQYNGNINTLGSETDNATAQNTVNISGSVPIAIVQTGLATAAITANVAIGTPGQWLYIVNRSAFNVSLLGNIVIPNAAMQFLNVTGLWTHVQ